MFSLDSTCSMLLTKGKRKGTPCGRKISSSNAFCKFHSLKPEPMRTCSMVLTKGARKTETCNRKVATLDTETLQNNTLCKLHWIAESKRPKNPYLEYEHDINLHYNSTEGYVLKVENEVLNLGKLNFNLALRLKEIKS